MDANLYKEAKTTANHVHLWNYHQQLLLLWFVMLAFDFHLLSLQDPGYVVWNFSLNSCDRSRLWISINKKLYNRGSVCLSQV